MQLLFFALVPAGIILLIYSVKSVHKTFSGDIIHEIPYSLKYSEYKISSGGYYSIWHKGTFFRKAPVDEYKPVIKNAATGESIRLSPSIFRPNSNDGKTARMELYRFYAPAGKYILELTEGSGISKIEKKIIDQIPARKVEYEKYFIQVRESQSRLVLMTGMFLLILSGLCIIGGLVLGILAKQIFNS